MAGHSWYISSVAGPATLRAAASRGKIDYFLRPAVRGGRDKRSGGGGGALARRWWRRPAHYD